jgi:hypothetical protein
VGAFLLKLFLQRFQEYVKDIQVQAIRVFDDCPEIIVYECREYDWPGALFPRGFIDFLRRISRLVIGIYKWHSHLPKFLSIKLRKEAVSQRFCGHTGLIRKKENGTFSHLRFVQICRKTPYATIPRIDVIRLSMSRYVTQGS